MKLAGGEIKDVGTDDVGRHQIRSELDALEGASDEAREDLGHKRLAGARNSFQEDVATREQSDCEVLKRVLESNEDLVVLGAHALPGCLQIGSARLVHFGGLRSRTASAL